mgnify:CR=1 FL=1
MTDISPEAAEDHLNISTNHEAGLIPIATQIFIRAQATRIAELEAQLAAWEAIEKGRV